MSFATGLPQPQPARIALVLSAVNLRRLTGGLRTLVGTQLDFGAVESQQPTAQVIEQLVAMNPAGIIMEFREELTEALANMGKPAVTVLADMLMEGSGCVNVDDFAVGRMAADYLWEKGLRNFAFYGFASEHAPGRKLGFAERLEGRGVVPSELEMPQGARPAKRLARVEKWLLELARPVGVFVAQDPLAREVVECGARLGLAIPAEVSVLSASNDQFTCELVYPGISSVEIPWREIGLAAARMLTGMFNGCVPAEPTLIAPTGIRTRGSTDFFRVADPSVQAAIAYLREHLEEDLGIDAVARHLVIDRRALERRFRSQLNRSPKQVLIKMRTERAREMLEQSAFRIGEIASGCGFGSSERLAAAFREHFGCTPREWRKRSSGLNQKTGSGIVQGTPSNGSRK